jgi:hypothetical protein
MLKFSAVFNKCKDVLWQVDPLLGIQQSLLGNGSGNKHVYTATREFSELI